MKQISLIVSILFAMTANAQQTDFTHDVEFTGFLKKILGKKLGKNYRTMLPSVLTEIKTNCRK